MIKAAPRLLIAGTGSGCGKTTVTCALLQAIKLRGCQVGAFKCGPDYIDTMFHSEIIGVGSANIDLYLAGESAARTLFARHALRYNVIEGVMGYYDGLSMTSDEASSWHVAGALDAPAVLIVSARGMALSASAVVKGFQALRTPSRIAGVIFNHVNGMIYPGLRDAVERECGVKAYGYLPPMPDCALESRHLGLVTAQEVTDLKDKLQKLASQAEKSVDIAGLLALMDEQAPIDADDDRPAPLGNVRIAVARDKAFCFYYRDNLELLEALGAELIPFSPLTDDTLPECDGLYLGGGYPELYAKALSANERMRLSIRAAVGSGLPTVAECGGFMYLTETIAGEPMVGLYPGDCFDTGKLTRFGYAALRAEGDSLLFRAGEETQMHEFHHWDAEKPGADLLAVKPSGRSWRCAYTSPTLYAGFPHLYFPARPDMARRFVQACIERKNRS